jgi:hypothetical protein
LLRNIDALERQVLAIEFADDQLPSMPEICWDDVVPTIFLVPWRRHVNGIAHRLSGITIGELPHYAGSPTEFAGRMGAADPREIIPEHALAGMVQTLGMALCVTLADAGFAIGGEPGGMVVARRGGVAIAPYDVIERMADGTIDPDRWRVQCERHGVAGLDLGAASAVARDRARSADLDGARPSTDISRHLAAHTD